MECIFLLLQIGITDYISRFAISLGAAIHSGTSLTRSVENRSLQFRPTTDLFDRMRRRINVRLSKTADYSIEVLAPRSRKPKKNAHTFPPIITQLSDIHTSNPPTETLNPDMGATKLSEARNLRHIASKSQGSGSLNLFLNTNANL